MNERLARLVGLYLEFEALSIHNRLLLVEPHVSEINIWVNLLNSERSIQIQRCAEHFIQIGYSCINNTIIAAICFIRV